MNRRRGPSLDFNQADIRAERRVHRQGRFQLWILLGVQPFERWRRWERGKRHLSDYLVIVGRLLKMADRFRQCADLFLKSLRQINLGQAGRCEEEEKLARKDRVWILV